MMMIQRSKLGIQDWSLSDLTVGLYLIYLQQASTGAMEDVKGELISSEAIVQDLIYHTELAKGAYKDSATGLARHSMIRENNTVKFIKISGVLRPGYYIGIDMRKKLVILGIRGTHTVYDLVTDIISSSHEEITFEGYSTHFGTAEAAHWFLTHEIDTLRKCLEKHKARGSFPGRCNRIFACSDFVVTVVMQDDIIPRLNVASLKRLRIEIVETDWVSVFKREDWKGVIDLVTNAKQVVSSVQDVAQKLTEYAKFKGQTEYSDMNKKKEVPTVPSVSHASNLVKHEGRSHKLADDLFVPGTVYYLKRNMDAERNSRHGEYFTLLRRTTGEHFHRILLSSNILSYHKCDSHYHALRDVFKGLPSSLEDRIF